MPVRLSLIMNIGCLIFQFLFSVATWGYSSISVVGRPAEHAEGSVDPSRMRLHCVTVQGSTCLLESTVSHQNLHISPLLPPSTLCCHLYYPGSTIAFAFVDLPHRLLNKLQSTQNSVVRVVFRKQTAFLAWVHPGTHQAWPWDSSEKTFAKWCCVSITPSLR